MSIVGELAGGGCVAMTVSIDVALAVTVAVFVALGSIGFCATIRKRQEIQCFVSRIFCNQITAI